MSDPNDKTTLDHQSSAQPTTPSPAAAGLPTRPEQLADLMNTGVKAAPAPNLEKQAMAAAEAALIQGQQALANARAQMAAAGHAKVPGKQSTDKPPGRGRELALRVMLAVNLLAMITVLVLPRPAGTTPPLTVSTPPETKEPPPTVRTQSLDDPVIRAFAAADRRDYRTAIRMLDEYLASVPRLDPAKKVNVLLALEHYATQIGDFAKAQESHRKTEALRSSHSLPEDLLAMAQEAEKSGDVDAMRRHYARLLLQQRQIPSALYRHVAEAYLKLGDSYRTEAARAADAARKQELEQLRLRLRQQAGNGGEEHGK